MQLNRRAFLSSFAAAPFIGRIGLSATTSMSSRERVDRALAGREVDRTPFSFWHHFGLQKDTTEGG